MELLPVLRVPGAGLEARPAARAGQGTAPTGVTRAGRAGAGLEHCCTPAGPAWGLALMAEPQSKREDDRPPGLGVQLSPSAVRVKPLTSIFEKENTH